MLADRERELDRPGEQRVVRLQPMRPGRRLVRDDIAVLHDGPRLPSSAMKISRYLSPSSTALPDRDGDRPRLLQVPNPSVEILDVRLDVGEEGRASILDVRFKRDRMASPLSIDTLRGAGAYSGPSK